jgi:DNA-binding winged helix-turn-helix (wHTH) protein
VQCIQGSPQETTGPTRAYRFGAFTLDLGREHLLGAGATRVLRRKTFATLRLLLDAAPALVTLDRLLDEVWGRHAISASAVPNVVAELRRALGDDARSPRYIETRHRRGYRMLAPVFRDAPAEPAPPLRPVPASPGEDALLAVIDACGLRPHESARSRLHRLHRLACSRGLAFLALQARLALQGQERAASNTLATGDARAA